MRWSRLGAIAVALFSLAKVEALAEPQQAINNWAELRAALARCWTVPSGTRGSLIALQFAIGRNGDLRGEPRVIASKFIGSQEAQQNYRKAAFEALAHCLPLNITDSFRPILMERPIRLRFVNTPPEPARQLGADLTIFAD